MPKFLDVHSLKGFEEETLRKLQQSPVDEFGIRHLNIMYNKEEETVSMVNICLNYNESVNYLDLDPLPPLFNKVRNNIFLLISSHEDYFKCSQWFLN